MAAAFKWLNRADASGPKLGTGVRTVYTATGVTAIVKEVVATNLTGSAASLTMYMVKSGGTAADYAIINAEPLEANETNIYSFNMVLEPGDTIQALCSVANAIGIHISGLEVS